jgi:hypothetical protein
MDADTTPPHMSLLLLLLLVFIVAGLPAPTWSVAPWT